MGANAGDKESPGAGGSGPAERRELPPTRLVIVDDHDLAREGLRDLLADEDDVLVVGEAADGEEALELCSRLLPDLVLMDVRMPRMDGLEATRRVKREHPKTAVLMVTMHENPDYLLEALRAGAAGYVLKDAPQEEVLQAVRQVRQGESPLDQELAAKREEGEGKQAGGPWPRPHPVLRVRGASDLTGRFSEICRPADARGISEGSL